ncbi:MAG: tetratricopeptide repeat protein [Myxococcales bacterium]|nr:tetratricopeptide repeat protein [Myxococcales bacterium]
MATRTRLVSGMILVLASAHCASTTGHRANHDRMRLVSASLASARPTFVAPPVVEETFAELAREIAEHDRANEGRGDWGPSACATLAERLERVARFGPRATAGDAYAAALLVHERCNRPERAQAVLARAEALEPLSCGVLVAIGLAHERAGRFEVAQRRYANSFCVEGTVRLGRLSRSLATKLPPRLAALTRASAITAFRQALRDQPTDPRALAGLAQVYLDEARANGTPLALTSAESASANAVIHARTYPVDSPAAREEHAHIAHARAEVLAALGRIAPAIDQYRRAVEFAPDAYEPRMNLASLLINSRDFASAADELAIVVQRFPTYDALVAQGVALAHLGRRGDAEGAYERARRIEPDRPDVFFNLAVLYAHMGRSLEELNRGITFAQVFAQKVQASPDPQRYAQRVAWIMREAAIVGGRWYRLTGMNAAAAMNAANSQTAPSSP